MTQRSNHPQIAQARPQAVVDASRLALLLATSVALILVLVLITEPISAEYGFA